MSANWTSSLRERNEVFLKNDLVSLRELTAKDVEGVHAFASDPVALFHTDWMLLDQEGSEGFLHYTKRNKEETPRLVWNLAVEKTTTEKMTVEKQAVEKNEPRTMLACKEKEFLGVVELRRDFEIPYCMEIGYLYKRSAWGKGYATAAANLLVEYALSLGTKRVQARCVAANTASAQVLLKIGMRLEKDVKMKIRTEEKDGFLYALEV